MTAPSVVSPQPPASVIQRFLANFRTLRARLMLWNAGAVAVTGLLILLAVRVGVRYTLISDLEQGLGADLQEIAIYFEDNQNYDWTEISQELTLKAQGHKHHRWSVHFY